jgi:hypothetical protein
MELLTAWCQQLARPSTQIKAISTNRLYGLFNTIRMPGWTVSG